jgi:hypothetical protein
MTASTMELKVKEIMSDSAMAVDEKVDELRKLRIEARDVQRAATESSMGADDGLQDDLRIVDKTLHQLGADIEEKGAATLSASIMQHFKVLQRSLCV